MITPAGHRVLIDVDLAELETDWGFNIGGDKNLENAAMITGTVVAVGPQAWKAFGPNFTGEPWAKVGDRIMYSKYSGNVIFDPETDIEYKIMNDEDITAVITGEKNNG